MWQTIRATGHYGIGQISSLGVALTVFPGFALQQPSSYGLTEGWLPVLAVAVYNLSDFAVRVANASIPCMAKPSALKHAALVVANLSAAGWRRDLVRLGVVRWHRPPLPRAARRDVLVANRRLLPRRRRPRRSAQGAARRA